MDKTTAQNIANECLYVLILKCKNGDFPAAYEFIASEIDLSDDEFIDAFKTIFPKESKKYGIN
jgi:hypothetical protein